MAIDRALPGLAAAEGVVVMRLYRWAPPCLSFGRHEPAARRYDRAAIECRGIDVVRRPTGGRAVWHARELTYAVAAPETALGGLREAYRRIHGWLAAAVERLGLPATLAAAPERASRPADGACFATPAGGEVLVDGWKVVGSAQVREGTALLQHGSMLLEDDQAMVQVLTRDAGSLSAAGRPLAALLGRPVAWEEAAGAVEAAVGTLLSGTAAPPALVAQALAHARQWQAQFQDPAWTWER
jgi:lipoate-protein ligase A